MAKTIDDLGGYGINNDQFNLFSTLNNQRDYQNYLNTQKNNYKSMTDNPIKWLAMGLKGEGWSEDDYLKNRGLDADTRKLGAAGQLSSSDMGKLADYGRSYDTNLGKELEGGRRLFSGIPLIGEILNPWAQITSAGKDLATSGISRWQNGKRDVWSDVGALGEAAFDVAGMGALGNAVKGGAKLGANVGKTALRTGALGAGENAFAALREGGKDTKLGDIATSAALGGAIGGGIGGVSQLFGNARAISNLSPSTGLMKVADANPIPSAQYQNALNTLGLTGQDVTSDAINQARKQAMKNTAKTVGYETAEGQAQRMAINNAYQTLLDNANGNVAQAVANPGPVNLPFAQRMSNLKTYMANNPSKIGQTTRNLLKTKAGKIGAGVGGGLLLSKLLFGGGGNNQELSDAEIEQLLNNYNNGGTYGY